MIRTFRFRSGWLLGIGLVLWLAGSGFAEALTQSDLQAFEQRLREATDQQRRELEARSAEFLPAAEEVGVDWRQPWELPEEMRARVDDANAYWRQFFQGEYVDIGAGRGLLEKAYEVPGLIATPIGRELVEIMGSPEGVAAMLGSDAEGGADAVFRQFLGVVHSLYAPMSDLLMAMGAQEYQGYRQLLEARERAPEGDEDPDLLALIERGLASPFAQLAEQALQQRLLDTLAMLAGVGVMDYYRSNLWGLPENRPAGNRGWLVEGRGVVFAVNSEHADLIPPFAETDWAPMTRDLKRLARETYALLLDITEMQTRDGAASARQRLESLRGEAREEEAQRIEERISRAEQDIARARDVFLKDTLGLRRCQHGDDCHVVSRINNRRSRGGQVQKILFGWFRIENFIARAVIAGNAPEAELQISMDQLLAAMHARLDGGEAAIVALDVNPRFTGVDDLAALTPDDIAGLDAERRGAISDGASRLMLRWPVAGAGTLDCEIVGGVDDGRCLSVGVLEHEEDFYAAAFYRPPNEFGEAPSPLERLNEEVESREISVELRFTPEPEDGESEAEAEARSVTRTRDLILVRPPVVLVHGTYDWPEKAWATDLRDGMPNLNRRLANAGFKTFMLDYRWSNGASSSAETEALTVLRSVPDQGASSFAANKLVVWSDLGHHPGEVDNGIGAALDYFRAHYNVAATRADVVGHSMGGVLPRVYASSGYNGVRYRRPENLGSGDIHRLITLCSTHFGSDVSRGLLAFKQLFPNDFSSGTEYLLARAVPILADWMAGLKTGAARDQIPESPALRLIGATKVPSHAIGCVASPADLDAYSGETGQLYTAMTYLFYAFPRLAEEALNEMGQFEDARRLVGISEGVDWNAVLNDLTKQGVIEIFPALNGALRLGDVGIDPLAITDKKLIRALGRAALFGNTRNDGVVRLQSQWGGLRRAYRTTLQGVDHSDAPRLPAVQDVIIRLLRGPQSAFDPDGFPRAGQPLLSADPNDPQSVAEKLEAIENSNIVYTHALAISDVARERQEVLIVRPVNSHSTRLIASDEATKGMLVKGKSADWGYQRGLIAVDQAFSKITGPSDTGAAGRIAMFNCEVLYSITYDIAVPRELRIRLDGRIFDVRRAVARSSGPYEQFGCEGTAEGKLVATDAFVNEIAERIQPGSRPPLFLRDAQGRYWDGEDPDRPARGVDDGNTLPLRVLADPRDGKYLTADYDLLAIGTRMPPGDARDDPVMGNVTDAYVATINAINLAVAATGYDGGNVVHHGPESHFNRSEGVDYPDTAFAPDGQIQFLREGPDGQKDRIVKRYFAAWRRVGWHMEPNARWNWGEFDEDSGLWPDEDLEGGDPGPGHAVPVLGASVTPLALPASTDGGDGDGDDDDGESDATGSDETPGLVFAEEDIVFGIADGNRLSRFRDRGGGRAQMVIDMQVPRNYDGTPARINAFAIEVLRRAAEQGTQIHFNLTGIEQVARVLNNQAYQDRVTSDELKQACFLIDLDVWRTPPKFYCNDREVPHPCRWSDPARDPCD